MRYRFALPDLGEGVAEGQVTEWLVAVGDTVEEDTMLLEVETDKATVEIPSPVAGTVISLGAEEGAVVAVGEVLLEFEVEGEAASSTAGEEAAPREGAASREQIAPAAAPAGEASAAQVLPAVRALARDLGVDLVTVAGSGAGGRITATDVHGAADGGASGDEAAAAPAARRTIAARLTRAAAVPTVTNVDDVELEAVLTASVSPLVALARAVVVALGENPRLNAFAEDGPTLVPQPAIHLGVATQTERGLVVPVVRDAQALDVDGLAAAITDVAGRAREGRTSPDELRGSTFTITSAGKLAGLFSTPLLNLPEVAILGIYRVEPRPVVRDGELVVRRISNLSITFDHRVLDGMDAAVFLAQVSEILETWPPAAG